MAAVENVEVANMGERVGVDEVNVGGEVNEEDEADEDEDKLDDEVSLDVDGYARNNTTVKDVAKLEWGCDAEYFVGFFCALCGKVFTAMNDQYLALYCFHRFHIYRLNKYVEEAILG